MSSSYGLTESVGSVTYVHDTVDLEILSDTIGWPHPAYEFRLAAPDGTPVPVGEPGEIQVRGDFIMLGYLNRPEATREAIDEEGWLHTGDLVQRDRDGYYYLIGRVDDLIITGGENVYPLEIEQVLVESPGVADCAVVGVPDPVWGQVVAAFLVPGGKAFDARANGKVLKFEAANPDASAVIDVGTRTTWDAFGLAVKGPLKGTRLKPLILIPEFWFAWSQFRPGTRLFSTTTAR